MENKEDAAVDAVQYTSLDDVDDLLSLVETVLADDPSDFLQLLEQTSLGSDYKRISGRLQKQLDVHVTAFSKGDIDLSRLLDVMMVSYIRLSAKASQTLSDPPENEDHKKQWQLRQAMASAWAEAFEHMLTGQKDLDAMGRYSCKLMMTSAQRSTMLKQMTQANLLQSLVGLLETTSPALALDALNIMDGLMILPLEIDAPSIQEAPVPLFNAEMCKTALLDKSFFEPLTNFLVQHIALPPKTDMEFVTHRAIDVYCHLTHLGQQNGSMIGFNPKGTGPKEVSVDYLSFGPGHLITINIRSDLESTAQVLLKSMERRTPAQSAALNEVLQRLTGARACEGVRHPDEDIEGGASLFSTAAAEEEAARKNAAAQEGEEVAARKKAATEEAAAREKEAAQGEKSCSACGKQGAGQKLKVCTGCRGRWYCGLTCQKADWKKGHKNECARAHLAASE